MTITPSWLRVLSVSLGYAVLFDISLILILSIALNEHKPEPLFFIAMFGIIYIICYVSTYLSYFKAIDVSERYITVHHHFEKPTKIAWQDINWADYRKKSHVLWRIFSRQGKRVIIPQDMLTRRDEKALSKHIIHALPHDLCQSTQNIQAQMA